MSDLHLIPPPRKLQRRRGEFPLVRAARLLLPDGARPAAVATAQRIAGEIARRTDHSPAPGDAAIACSIDLDLTAEGYALRIAADGIALRAGGDAGLFYGLQTLLQIVRQSASALPALQIEDAPDFPVRGFYHDIARGKVPTRDTLFALVEKMAHYKLNQFQLYVEHTFAFRRHPDIWAGSDPLTHDDVLALDEHCARHHIELVPSLSTFGHFYTALTNPRKQHLNEFPLDGSRLPFSWWDRMGHYTLDCLNPGSLALVGEMIAELRPLFRSDYFNLCCDETFDLGKGRNQPVAARRGVGRLYVDFLKQLMRLVRSHGATPMFWGDILGNHPELVREVPTDAIALDWDYSADLHDTKSLLFKQAGRPFYACPGCCGWDRWINDLDTATCNILDFAKRGKRDGAIGLLNTDWGDRGHVNALGNSYHGLLLGAAAGWNARGTLAPEFDAAFNALEIGDASQRFAAVLREIGSAAIVPWKQLVLWFDPTPHRPARWWDEVSGIPIGITSLDPTQCFAAYTRIEALRGELQRIAKHADAQDPLALDEALVGARGQALMQALGGWLSAFARNANAAVRKKNGTRAKRSALAKVTGIPNATQIADELRRFEADASAIWHARNRPSEYFRIRGALLELARRLDRLALGLTPLRTVRAAVP